MRAVGICESDVDAGGAAPGQPFVRADGVVPDPALPDLGGQVDDTQDLFEEESLVLQRPEGAFA